MSSGGRFAARALGFDVSLAVPDRAPVVGRLASITMYQDDGELDVRVAFTLTIPLETYERIQDEQLFDVSLATSAPDEGMVAFWGDAPLDLELGLVPSLARVLRGPAAGPSWATAATETLDDLIDRLVAALAGSDAELPLTQAASYRWLRVLQAQPSTSGASVRLGLRSIYCWG